VNSAESHRHSALCGGKPQSFLTAGFQYALGTLCARPFGILTIHSRFTIHHLLPLNVSGLGRRACPRSGSVLGCDSRWVVSADYCLLSAVSCLPFPDLRFTIHDSGLLPASRPHLKIAARNESSQSIHDLQKPALPQMSRAMLGSALPPDVRRWLRPADSSHIISGLCPWSRLALRILWPKATPRASPRSASSRSIHDLRFTPSPIGRGLGRGPDDSQTPSPYSPSQWEGDSRP